MSAMPEMADASIDASTSTGHSPATATRAGSLETMAEHATVGLAVYFLACVCVFLYLYVQRHKVCQAKM